MEERAMKCTMCGSTMKTNRENVHYDEVGMPGVTLINVEVSRCAKCGEYEVAIPRIEELHRQIAQMVIEKPGRLTGTEIRFLRKFLGYSGADFAKHVGSDPSTISRWENGKETMNRHADLLLRLMVVHGARVQEYALARLSEVAKDDAPQSRYELESVGKTWRGRFAA
jgi:putative zinc finger/helix-turn-helix YgiT family protein